MFFRGLLCAFLGALLGQAWAAPVDEAAALGVHQLDASNFADKTAAGTWVVKHYSPRCKHCKHFQPVWEKAVRDHSKTLLERNVHFGEVDCRANEDLCDSNKIESWPTVVILNQGGKAQLVGDNPEGDLVRFIERHVGYGLTTPRRFTANSVVLDAGNFTKEASEGVWLVKHYSPFCPHCRRMAPEWAKMTDQLAVQLEPLGIFFGEVNCIDNRRLCEANLVDGYPTVNLFVNGKFVEEMLLKYEYAVMKSYVDQLPKRVESGELGLKAKEPVVANDNRDWDDAPADPKPEAAKGDVNVEEKAEAASPLASAPMLEPAEPEERYNEEGEVVVLTGENFVERTATGPWFIKFYAPWCPHCKEMAPEWVKLAGELRGSVNVGMVNCEEYSGLCGVQGVQGYPTLKLMWEGESLLFKGSRDVENMRSFADASMAQPRRIRAADEVDFMRADSDVVFVFAYGGSARGKEALKRVKASMRKMFLSKKLGIVEDPAVAREILGPNAPEISLAALKDGQTIQYKGSFASDDALREWLYAERFPLLSEFTRENADSLFYDSDYLVLLIADSEAEGFVEHRDSVRDAAVQYQRLIEAEPAGAKSVRFTWLDGSKWAGYVKRVYRIEQEQWPAVVIVQPSEDRFFVNDVGGAPITVTKPAVFSAVKAAVSGRLKAQSTRSIIVRAIKGVGDGAVWVGRLLFGTMLRSMLTVLALAAMAYYYLASVRRRRGRGRGMSGGLNLVKAD
ncbi:hypothetical protein GGF46_005480 [Coemansia sp. RSA 552]|nr:hypothetical protein GGF46_005480 [Coemansia sp. RSA 552]